MKRRFELNDETLQVIEVIGGIMPGGFFIYRASDPGELIYANEPVYRIYGCKNAEEFRELTGNTFRGMVHPDDYTAINNLIDDQIKTNDDLMDYVEYRIVRKDGSVRWVEDYGHYSETSAYGGVYTVFISDSTRKREQQDKMITALASDYRCVYHVDLDRNDAVCIRHDPNDPVSDQGGNSLFLS